MKKSFFGIKSKLIVGFLAITIVLFATVAVNLYFIIQTKNFSENVIKYRLPVFSHLVDLDNEILVAENTLQSWLITHDNKYQDHFKTIWNNIEKTVFILDEAIQSHSLKSDFSTWNQIKSNLNELKNLQSKLINSSNSTQASADFVTKILPVSTQLQDLLNTINSKSINKDGIIDIQSKELQEQSQTILVDLNSLYTFEYVMLIVGVILSIAIASVTANKIVPPLKKAILIANKISSGERKIKVEVNSNDEIGELLFAIQTMLSAIVESEKKLAHNEKNTRDLLNKIVKSANQFSAHSSKVASGDLRQKLDVDPENQDVMNQLGNDLNKMTENLATITKEITKVCQHMVTTVEEVRHAVDIQSSGASEQASSINEITASLSEIEKSSSQTIEKAKALGESAERTRETGQQGLTAVDQSVVGMKSVRDKVQIIAQTILDLSSQTQQVGEITSVVNNLAQQSKMLALNASIEAAKAGEAGKGFSVVAIEVKNLAEQSEQATTQVQKILEDIRKATEKAVMVTEEGTKGVDAGTNLVEQTGDIIRNLNDVIHETTIATQQIESAVRQESAGIEQITAGMNEINQVTTSFVESVKQTTEAISNLSDIARNLKSYIDAYKL